MTKLLYTPCKCIRRGDAILPGTRGSLYAVTKGRVYFVAPCPRCKEHK